MKKRLLLQQMINETRELHAIPLSSSRFPGLRGQLDRHPDPALQGDELHLQPAPHLPRSLRQRLHRVLRPRGRQEAHRELAVPGNTIKDS